MFAATVALAATAAVGWGPDGHRIVGEIAWHELSPEARQQVRELLEPGRYGTLYESCVWADSEARDDPRYAWADRLHYINVPLDREAPLEEPPTDTTLCPDGACVVEATRVFAARLAGADAIPKDTLPATDRRESLRFLCHFVGDLHQPLHVAHADGRGGTRTHPEFRGSRKHTMHRLWDSTLLDTYEGSWRSRADRWREAITPEQRAAWLEDDDPWGWADESLRLAQRRDLFRYRSGDRLPRSYPGRAEPEIRRRLQQAGIRLGALLNRLLAEPPAPPDPG